MNVPILFAAGKSQFELVYIWDQATPEARVIIFCLIIFSVVAWYRDDLQKHPDAAGEKLNQFFAANFARKRRCWICSTARASRCVSVVQGLPGRKH